MDQLSADLASLRIGRDEPTGPSPVRRFAVIVGVLAGLAGLGILAVKALGAQVFKQEVAITEIAMISPVQSAVQVTSTGYVVPQVSSKVGAKVPGRLASVLIKEGDAVKANDVIATIADDDQKSALAAANARVLVARARAETALANLADVKQQLQRTRGLLAGNAVPRAQVEDLEARALALTETANAARAETVAAQAEAETLRTALKDRVIVSPINGTVISKPASIGESIGLTNPIAEIADFDSILVETDVPEARLGLVGVGTPCEIVLDAYPSRRYRGETTEIGRRVNRAKATVVVKVKFKDTTEGVLPDMAARVSFLNEEIKPETLEEKPKKIVSAEAVIDRDGGKALFVVDNGKLRIDRVTVGQSIGNSIELLDGPTPGTRVVNRPAADLREGQKIKEQDR